jgi:tetratricopeptide (TPR) repeat protein
MKMQLEQPNCLPQVCSNYHVESFFFYLNGVTGLERFIFESPTCPSDVSRQWQADIMMAANLAQIGEMYSHKFEQTGHPHTLAGAIQLFRRAVDLPPPDDPMMPDLQSYLGKLLSLRFRYMGDPCDISEAILFQQKSVNLTQDDAGMHSRLNNLAESSRYRYEYTGDPRDISEAISLQRQAVDLTPEGHVDYPGLLHNLGILLMARFELTEDLHDVSETISIERKAIELSPQGHPNRRQMLSNISNSFRNRFLRTKDPHDITEAISLQRESLDFTPKVHAEFISMSFDLHNLGILLRCRFETTEAPSLSDLSEAISVENKAVALAPLGYRDTPNFLNSLGLSLERLFNHTKDPKDIRQSISRYSRAATWYTGIPIVRFYAAEKWAQLSAKFDRSTLFDAYNTTIQLLSRVVGLEQTVEKRYIGLASISKISVEAVAAAFSLGKHETALEWLEHGRCLVWNQLNDLRTPLDALRKHNPALADHFYDISRRLEHSGHRSEFLGTGNYASMAQKLSIQEDVNTHVKLAQEWEQTLEKIRKIPEFEDFLRPPRASGLLKKLPTDGDVIVINVHETRCDALALISGAEAPLHIPLHDFSHEQADNLRSLLHGYLSSWGMRSRGSEPDEVRGAHKRSTRKNASDSDIRSILGQLWLNVVKPILDKLAISVSNLNIYLNYTGSYLLFLIEASSVGSSSYLVVLNRSPCIPSHSRCGHLWSRSHR